MVAFGIFSFVFWILMIIDVAQRKFEEENEKILWLLIVILTGFVGAMIYYFMIIRAKKPENKPVVKIARASKVKTKRKRK